MEGKSTTCTVQAHPAPLRFAPVPPTLVLLLLLQAKHPCILQHFNTFLERVNGKRVAVFLDYDGTFTQRGWCWCSCTCKPPPTGDHS